MYIASGALCLQLCLCSVDVLVSDDTSSARSSLAVPPIPEIDLFFDISSLDGQQPSKFTVSMQYEGK